MKRTSAVAAMIQAVSPVFADGAAVASWASESNGHSNKPSAAGARLDRAFIFSSPRHAAGRRRYKSIDEQSLLSGNERPFLSVVSS
jgi:hypothetical protein